VEAVDDLGKIIEKKLPVGIVPKDGLLFVAPGGDVVKRAVVFDP
jgi:hypothetical protein